MRRLIQYLLSVFGFALIRKRYLNADLALHLRNVLDGHSIDCVLDVGANVGQYGRLLRG